MKVLDLFSGIGGFSLGLERAGFETVAFCEIEDSPRQILANHWPGVPIYDDVRKLTGNRLAADGITADVICGGFPCQPWSLVGKRRGTQDDRHLWPEYYRLIRELKPRWIIGENVYGFIDMGLDQALSDLESEGYTAEAFVIPACALRFDHRRDRVWIIAYADSTRLQGWNETLLSKWEAAARHIGPLPWRETSSRICRKSDGISKGMDRLKALGNAVVPQIPELIGRAIMEHAARPGGV